MCDLQCSQLEDLRLFELLVRFKQGDENSYPYILKRFKRLIEKESYNCYLGVIDEDLRSQIYTYLLIRLRQYVISDAITLEVTGVHVEQKS